MSRAALEAIVEALEDGNPNYALAVALSALEDDAQPGTANPPLLRPPGGWPGERWRP
jgi:hypothetical protein